MLDIFNVLTFWDTFFVIVFSIVFLYFVYKPKDGYNPLECCHCHTLFKSSLLHYYHVKKKHENMDKQGNCRTCSRVNDLDCFMPYITNDRNTIHQLNLKLNEEMAEVGSHLQKIYKDAVGLGLCKNISNLELDVIVNGRAGKFQFDDIFRTATQFFNAYHRKCDFRSKTNGFFRCLPINIKTKSAFEVIIGFYLLEDLDFGDKGYITCCCGCKGIYPSTLDFVIHYLTSSRISLEHVHCISCQTIEVLREILYQSAIKIGDGESCAGLIFLCQTLLCINAICKKGSLKKYCIALHEASKNVDIGQIV